MLTVDLRRLLPALVLASLCTAGPASAAVESSGEVVEIPALPTAPADGTAPDAGLPPADVQRPGLPVNIDPATGERPVYRLRPEPYNEKGKQVVTLDQLIALAEQSNYGVNAQALRVESSRYDIDKTYFAFDPTVAANLSYSKRNIGGARAAQTGGAASSEGLSTDFTVTIPREAGDSFSFGYNLDRSRFSVGGSGGTSTTSPTTFGSGFTFGYDRPLLRGAGKHVNLIPRYIASNNYELQNFTLHNRHQVLRHDLINAYYLAAAQREAISVRSASLDRALAQLDRAVERYKVGLAIQADVLQAENVVLQQRAALLQSYEDYDTDIDQLTAIVGLPQEYEITVDPNEALLAPDETYEPSFPPDLWDLVTANDLDLHGLSTQIQNLELTRDQLANATKPQLNLSATYGRTGEDTTLGRAVTGFENESYSVGLAWRSTPGEHTAKANLAQNDLDIQGVDLQIKDTQLQLKTRLRDLQRDLSTKLEQIDLMRSNVTVAQQNLDIVTERQNVGLATQLDIRQAEEDLLSAQLNLLTAQLAYQQSYRDIELMAGLI